MNMRGTQRKKKAGQGFSMVEVLVVLVIVAILAAVAAPIYMANTKRAIASEAVATMSLIRQAEREYKIRSGSFSGDLDSAGIITTLAINAETTQYFSQDAYSVDTTSPAYTNGPTTPPGAQGFLITADAANSKICPTGAPNCAAKDSAQKMKIKVEEDNSGRTRVAYDGTTWEDY